MREIKFRGMSISGEWFYGYLIVITTGRIDIERGSYISNKMGSPFAYQVRPETVGQFTGLTDRNGKEIFEGDIIRIGHPHKGRSYTGPIVYENYRYTAKDFYFPHHDDPGNPFESLDYMEIIGNIYENPELLEATP